MRKTRDEKRRKVNEGKLDARTYKIHKNFTRKIMREAERQYYTNIFDEKKRYAKYVESYRENAQPKQR